MGKEIRQTVEEVKEDAKTLLLAVAIRLGITGAFVLGLGLVAKNYQLTVSDDILTTPPNGLLIDPLSTPDASDYAYGNPNTTCSFLPKGKTVIEMWVKKHKKQPGYLRYCHSFRECRTIEMSYVGQVDSSIMDFPYWGMPEQVLCFTPKLP